MSFQKRIFFTPARGDVLVSMSDLVVLLIVVVVLYLGIQLSLGTPAAIQGPEINLSPVALPFYAFLSIGRMLAAYILSLLFSLMYGYTAARNRSAEVWLMPLLDILQSVPILSFLPVVLLSLTAVLPQRVAVELAAIILIFTSQAWNLTFSFYQSMTTLPMELREAAAIYRFSPWLRFTRVELPFAALGLIWNSVMSWAGGWFFLMAAEIFTLGARDFRLPGLGAYLQTAANAGNTRAIVMGIGTLVLIIILLDQVIWQPMLAWAEQFKVSQVGNDNPATSWFLTGLERSQLTQRVSTHLVQPLLRSLDRFLNRPPGQVASLEPAQGIPSQLWVKRGILWLLAAGLGYGLLQVGLLLITVPLTSWENIAVGALATLLRVSIAVGIALAWTVPIGVLIGTNPRAASILQPLVQIAASIPATALFPILLLGLLDIPGGGNIAAVLLMLLGTQWYLLFNIIAGSAAIPQDLYYTSDLLGLRGWQRWRILILPALFPYILTGVITASGGAWNASIVAEFTHFGGRISEVTGLGALITAATAAGDYRLLLASTLTMIIMVVAINRLVWRRLYRDAEYRFRMDQ